MGRKFARTMALLSLLALMGCVTSRPREITDLPRIPRNPDTEIIRANDEGTLPVPQPLASPLTRTVGLPELIELTVERHPRLTQVTWAIEAARGRAVQAGLYPNPTLSVSVDELGDNQGPAGIWTAPYFSQEIVRGNKLVLAQAAALKEVDQNTLQLASERYRLFTEVRQNYFEYVLLQRRVEILRELIKLANTSVENANKLLKAKEGTRLDVIQLEVDRERYKAELDATNSELPAVFRRLCASVGVRELPFTSVEGDLEIPLPDYDLEQLRAYMFGIHPDIRSAQVAVERAELLVQRAIVEPIPNITVGAGYVRQSQNRSNDLAVGVSLPIPVWNKNQGNVLAARAQVGEAISEVKRVQIGLDTRLATAFGGYASARKRAENYKKEILPRAEESYQLSLKAYQGGQFEYLRVLQAQRSVAEARLEYLRSLGEMWKSASELAGLMLEDVWPPMTASKQ